MKKELPAEELSDNEMATSQNDEPQQPTDGGQGRSGEGAHSAMKHWLHEERNRHKRPEH